MTGDRLQPIPPAEWSRELTEGLREAYRPSNPRHPVSPLDPASPKALNAMGVLAHHPELTDAYNRLIRHALYFTTISIRQRELLILRVAHLRDSLYEWAQHVYQAGVAGIAPDEVARVRIGPAAEGWTALERALLSAADELVADARITDDTYAALAADLDAQQLMDVVFTVGAYDVFAMALRTFDVELDDDLRPYA
jgi:alkylhydroperoxidase family enzyme